VVGFVFHFRRVCGEIGSVLSEVARGGKGRGPARTRLRLFSLLTEKALGKGAHAEAATAVSIAETTIAAGATDAGSIAANAATARCVVPTPGSRRNAKRVSRLRPLGQSEARERHAGEAETEFFERLPSRYRLGQALGEFIEFIVHTFPFVVFFCLTADFTDSTDTSC